MPFELQPVLEPDHSRPNAKHPDFIQVLHGAQAASRVRRPVAVCGGFARFPESGRLPGGSPSRNRQYTHLVICDGNSGEKPGFSAIKPGFRLGCAAVTRTNTGAVIRPPVRRRSMLGVTTLKRWWVG